MRLAPLLLALALAGCLGPAPPGPGEPGGPPVPAPSDWAVRALPFGEGHDHGSPAEHANLSTPNFRVLGWDPLPTDLYSGASAGGYFCGETATTAEGRQLAVVGSFSSDVAFVVADVTDPARPAKVGEYALPGVHVYDVAMTRDGLHVLVGTNPEPPGLPVVGIGDALGTRTVQPIARACGGPWRPAGPEQQFPLTPGLVLVGIADPANPQPVGRWVLPVDVQWDGFLMFSTHYVDLVNRTMFVAMYHGGVWAVDLSGNLGAPRTVGVFVPDRVPNVPAHASDGWAVNVLQALALPTGDLVVYDDATGLYVVRFDPSVAVPPVAPWAEG